MNYIVRGVEEKKELYLKSSRQLDKRIVAMDIVKEWRAMDPSGRFSKQELWKRPVVSLQSSGFVKQLTRSKQHFILKTFIFQLNTHLSSFQQETNSLEIFLDATDLYHLQETSSASLEH